MRISPAKYIAVVTIFALILLTPTYTAGMEPRSLQQRNDRLNAAKVSNMIILPIDLSHSGYLGGL